jgi:hypothetical protein
VTLSLPAGLADVPIEDLEDMLCRANPGVWAERKLGFTNAPFHWEWYQLMTEESRLCVIAPREHAKALALDTPVLTPGGHVPLQDVQVGDTVLCRTGWTTVTAKSEVFTDHDCYRVALDDGQSFVADAGHRWMTNYAWRGAQVVTTADIAADQASRTDQRHVIDCVPSAFPDVYLPVDPYVLGVWLGDGSTSRAEITGADPEILSAVEDAGYVASYQYRRGAAVTQGYTGGLWRGLRLLGVLGDKHVPELYLWADEKARLALLQGLMDTDGQCSPKGQALFRVMSPRLADAVAHLVWSLGMKPKRFSGPATLDGRTVGTYYGVSFYPTVPAFRLERKLTRQRTLPEGRRSKATGRAVTVAPTLTVPVQCLTTEAGDFLIGEGVVTHNSEVFTVNGTAWRSCYWPGWWTYVFAATGDQAKELKARIDAAVMAVRPELVLGARVNTKLESTYANGARLTVAGAGKSVRGAHPDTIIGDDVLEEQMSLTEHQRKKTTNWWFGAVGGMAHPGTSRVVRGHGRLRFPPTQIRLVGTPFHTQDLLMSTGRNLLWHYRRYAAEFDTRQLVPGTHAVEVRNG